MSEEQRRETLEYMQHRQAEAAYSFRWSAPAAVLAFVGFLCTLPGAFVPELWWTTLGGLALAGIAVVMLLVGQWPTMRRRWRERGRR